MGIYKLKGTGEFISIPSRSLGGRYEWKIVKKECEDCGSSLQVLGFDGMTTYMFRGSLVKGYYGLYMTCKHCLLKSEPEFFKVRPRWRYVL